MRTALPIAVLICAVAPACAQQPTLGEALKKLGIPEARFTPAELTEHVVGMDAKDGDVTYFVYVPGDQQSAIDAAPRLVRFTSASGEVLRNNLKPDQIESCCGTSPLKIDFTHGFLLASFHANPSADVVLVADKQLQYKTMLYGFEFHEIAPDRLVYVENEVHFAPAHPGRLALADLNTGKARELYPSTNDPQRDAFAEFHAKHMPDKTACAEANDPCEEDLYDEDIEFLGATQFDFQIQVKRTAGHTQVTHGTNLDVPVAVTAYTYSPAADGWRYCAQQVVPPTLMNFEHAQQAGEGAEVKSCEPNLKVIPDTPGEFTPHAQEAK